MLKKISGSGFLSANCLLSCKKNVLRKNSEYATLYRRKYSDSFSYKFTNSYSDLNIKHFKSDVIYALAVKAIIVKLHFAAQSK